MAKRERKAWLVVDKRGSPESVEWTSGTARLYAYLGTDERVVRCTITWDDGKPAKAAAKRKGAKQ